MIDSKLTRKRLVLFAFVVLVVSVVGFTWFMMQPPGEEEAAEEMHTFLLHEDHEFSLTVGKTATTTELHTLHGGQDSGDNKVKIYGDYLYEVDGTIEGNTRARDPWEMRQYMMDGAVKSEKEYETKVDERALSIRKSNSTETLFNESFPGVTEDDFGETFHVEVGDRSEWRFVSYQDELAAIIDETESVEEDEPRGGWVNILLDSDEEEVAEYLNRLQEAPSGKTFVEIPPDEIEEYEVKFSYNYEAGIQHTGTPAFLFVYAETTEWTIITHHGRLYIDT